VIKEWVESLELVKDCPARSVSKKTEGSGEELERSSSKQHVLIKGKKEKSKDVSLLKQTDNSHRNLKKQDIGHLELAKVPLEKKMTKKNEKLRS